MWTIDMVGSDSHRLFDPIRYNCCCHRITHSESWTASDSNFWRIYGKDLNLHLLNPDSLVIIINFLKMKQDSHTLLQYLSPKNDLCMVFTNLSPNKGKYGVALVKFSEPGKLMLLACIREKCEELSFRSNRLLFSCSWSQNMGQLHLLPGILSLTYFRCA